MYFKFKIGQYLLIASLSLFVASTLIAQTPYQEFEKILAVYKGDKIISYQLEYRYFDDLETDVVSDSMIFKMVQSKGQSYMDTPIVTVFQSKKQQLTIDKEKRQIYMQTMDTPPVFNLEQLEQTAEHLDLELQFLEVDNAKKGLVFIAPTVSNTRIEMIYEPTTYRLLSSLIHIDQAGAYGSEFNQTRFEATYSNYKQHTKFPYATKTFIRQEGKKWKGVGAYATYQVSML